MVRPLPSHGRWLQRSACSIAVDVVCICTFLAGSPRQCTHIIAATDLAIGNKLRATVHETTGRPVAVPQQQACSKRSRRSGLRYYFVQVDYGYCSVSILFTVINQYTREETSLNNRPVPSVPSFQIAVRKLQPFASESNGEPTNGQGFPTRSGLRLRTYGRHIKLSQIGR